MVVAGREAALRSQHLGVEVDRVREEKSGMPGRIGRSRGKVPVLQSIGFCSIQYGFNIFLLDGSPDWQGCFLGP